LARLRVWSDELVLQTMLWPDEVRAADFDFLHEDLPEVRQEEMSMAGMLIDSLSEEVFEPDKFHDDYREAVLELIDAKAEGQTVTQPAQETTGEVVDLMAALQASVESAKKGDEKMAAEGAAGPAAKGGKKPAKQGRAETKETAWRGGDRGRRPRSGERRRLGCRGRPAQAAGLRPHAGPNRLGSRFGSGSGYLGQAGAVAAAHHRAAVDPQVVPGFVGVGAIRLGAVRRAGGVHDQRPVAVVDPSGAVGTRRAHDPWVPLAGRRVWEVTARVSPCRPC